MFLAKEISFASSTNPHFCQKQKEVTQESDVYKCEITNQLFLIAYQFDDVSLTLLMVAPHENFYRNLKKTL
jgi:hypothetical protein